MANFWTKPFCCAGQRSGKEQWHGWGGVVFMLDMSGLNQPDNGDQNQASVYTYE